MNALLAAIFLTASISWRAFWASALALCAFEGLRKLGPLRLRVTLQGLVLLDEILELLLDLADPGLLLLARGAFLGRFVFGLG